MKLGFIVTSIILYIHLGCAVSTDAIERKNEIGEVENVTGDFSVNIFNIGRIHNRKKLSKLSHGLNC